MSSTMRPTPKILKPDPMAYRDCIDRLGLSASACVFVDDQHRNIVGARNVGLRVVHFDVHAPADSYRQALNMLALT